MRKNDKSVGSDFFDQLNRRQKWAFCPHCFAAFSAEKGCANSQCNNRFDIPPEPTAGQVAATVLRLLSSDNSGTVRITFRRDSVNRLEFRSSDLSGAR